MSMCPWDQGSQGLLGQRGHGTEGTRWNLAALLPAAWAARAGVRRKPPTRHPQQVPPLWPVPLLEEVAVTGRAVLGAGAGWWLLSHPRIPGFILVTATVLPQEPKRVIWVWVVLSPTVQGCPGILCVVMLSVWVGAGQEGVAEQPGKCSHEEGWP